MARKVELTEQEVEFITDVLSYWVDGFVEVKEATTQDGTIEDVEALLSLIDGLEEQKSMADVILVKFELAKEPVNE